MDAHRFNRLVATGSTSDPANGKATGIARGLSRAVAFIDYANIKSWARSLGYSVDLEALREGLMSAEVSSFRFYYGTDGKNENAASFFHKIASFGYIVVTKAVQYFSISFYDLLEQPFNMRWLQALPKGIQETLIREAERLDAEGIRLLQPKLILMLR